jgi:uncharacterized protein YegP (UPF0339 family)
MKANVKDQYDFEQLSPSQKPGFEVFFSEKYKAWFFHANDVKGKSILFSQSYQTEDSAENGLLSVLKNIIKGRIYKRTEGGQHFLTVIAGNNQEVGRSPFLKDENAADTALTFLKQVVKSPNPLVSVETQSIKIENIDITSDDEPTRRRFSIYFYKNADDNNLSGRIEDMADSKSGVTFQGIDNQVIMGFIRQNIEGQLQDKSPTVADSKGLEIASTEPVKEVKIDEPKAMGNHKVDYESQLLLIETNMNNRNTPSVKLTMDLPEMVNNFDGRIIGSEIIALQADTKHTSRFQNVESIPNEDKSKLVFSFSPNSLPESGTYRLEASAWVSGQNQEVMNLKGSCWAYFF